MIYPLLEKLIELDTGLFFLLNCKAQNVVFDFLMPILTNLDYWRIPLGLLAVSLLIFGKKRGRIAVMLLVIGITLSDQVCNSVFKPLVARVRPCSILENIHLLVNCTKGYSFPSSHATNIFTGMILLSYIYPKIKAGALTIAVLVSYSRVYVGVHYPFDVFAGIALGIVCAIIIMVIHEIFARMFPKVFYVPEISKARNQNR